MNQQYATGVEQHEAIAARMYPDAPPPVRDTAPNAAVQAVRDEHGVARTMYPDDKQFGKNSGSAREFALVLNPSATEQQLEKEQTTIAAIAVDSGLTRDDLSTFAGYAAGFQAKPPTPAERAAFQRTSVKELRAQYGPQFDQVFRDATALARRDPRLAKILNTTAIGDHPAVIARFAELGRAARARGQLK